MTFLLADSGSTKTLWHLQHDNGSSATLSTQGLPPRLTSDEQFHAVLNRVTEAFEGEVANPFQLFFYGSGCGSSAQCDRYTHLLRSHWPQASQVYVASDLLGACRATFADSNGLVGIIGTGSNACRYAADAVETSSPSLGYLLGDEGSGCALGIQIWRLYWNRQLPDHLTNAFHELFPLSLPEFLDRVYMQPYPNRFLASAVPFLANYRNEPTIRDILDSQWRQYFTTMVKPLVSDTKEQLALVGGVAAQFEDELRQAASIYCPELSVVKVLSDPVSDLIAYHVNHQLK